jgi:hypothetical protein
MTKRLSYPLQTWPALPRAVLTEAIRCVLQAESDLFGEVREEGASYHTLMLPGTGRLFAKESVLKKWFKDHFEGYATLMAEQLETNPTLGWLDIAVLSVPFRRDRLCLTLAPAQGQSTLYWNWTGSRHGWRYSDPAEVERTFHLVGKIPFTEGLQTGFKVSRKEIQSMQPLSANPERLQNPPRLVLVPSAEIRPPAAPVEPPKKPRPEGGPQTPPEELVLGDERIFEHAEKTVPIREHKLPDGRMIEIVDWNDISLPFGRRVQSKVAALMQVEHLTGKVLWASEEQLRNFPYYADRGSKSAVPGTAIKDMHFKTGLGRVILRANKLLWAYWTGEVPEEIRQKTYIHSHVQAGTLNGIYNLLAKGWKAGNKAEEQFFREKGYLARKEQWRDWEGNDASPEVKDRKYSRTVSADFPPDQGSPSREIKKGTLVHTRLAKIFAAKAKKGELTPEQAYSRAIEMSMNFLWQAVNLVDDNESAERKEANRLKGAEMRSWVEPEQLNQLDKDVTSWHNSAAQPGNLKLAVNMGNRTIKEKYGTFTECWLTRLELSRGIVQEEFKLALGLVPEDYGQERIDLEELAESRGKIPE